MAEKTEEHKKLIAEAKGLGIAAAHMTGIPKLKEKIEAAKKANAGDPPSKGSDAGATGAEELSPIAASIKRLEDGKDKDPAAPPEKGKDTPTDPEKKNDPPSGDSTVKEGDGYLYHETEEPRLFVDGEEVPDGWNIENRKLWKVTDNGKYINVNG